MSLITFLVGFVVDSANGCDRGKGANDGEPGMWAMGSDPDRHDATQWPFATSTSVPFGYDPAGSATRSRPRRLGSGTGAAEMSAFV